MSHTKLFRIERDGDTLIAVPLRTVVSLAEEDVQAEMDNLAQELAEPDVKNLIIDFEATEYFGSSMLVAMQSVWRHVYAQRGRMNLCNVSVAAREILRLVRLESHWPIYPTREEALKALRSE